MAAYQSNYDNKSLIWKLIYSFFIISSCRAAIQHKSQWGKTTNIKIKSDNDHNRVVLNKLAMLNHLCCKKS